MHESGSASCSATEFSLSPGGIFFPPTTQLFTAQQQASTPFTIVLRIYCRSYRSCNYFDFGFHDQPATAFPQLGPSAFILFYTPMSEQASPRNVFLSHLLGVGIGLLSLWLCSLAFPDMHLIDSHVLNWQREIVVACSMGLACLLMVVFKCVHPPAAASALIAALGYFEGPEHVIGIVAAVVLLLLAALFFNRFIGGCLIRYGDLTQRSPVILARWPEFPLTKLPSGAKPL